MLQVKVSPGRSVFSSAEQCEGEKTRHLHILRFDSNDVGFAAQSVHAANPTYSAPGGPGGLAEAVFWALLAFGRFFLALSGRGL